MTYFVDNPTDPVDDEKFKAACGIGITVTAQDIKDMVRYSCYYLFKVSNNVTAAVLCVQPTVFPTLLFQNVIITFQLLTNY